MASFGAQKPESLMLRNAFTGAVTAARCDFVVAGMHPEPNVALYETLARHGRVIMAGDIVAPRGALEADREGDRAARIV